MEATASANTGVPPCIRTRFASGLRCWIAKTSHPARWCCIDRLSSQHFAEVANNVGSVNLFFKRASPFTSKRVVVRRVFWPCRRPRLTCNLSVGFSPTHTSLRSQLQTMITRSNSLWRGSGMPIQVHGVLLHAISGTELSRVRTEFGPLRILPTISPHPVQPQVESSGHVHLGDLPLGLSDGANPRADLS